MKTLITTGQMAKFLELLQQEKMTPERFQKILESGKLTKILKKFYVTGSFRFTVDYSLSLAEMIKAGNYTETDPNIMALFQFQGEGQVEYEACCFNSLESSWSNEVIAAILDEELVYQWQPAKIEHLCAFGATYPDEQRECQIVGLGSVVKLGNDRRVPILWGTSFSHRELDLGWFNIQKWRDSYRFLAVRKVLP